MDQTPKKSTDQDYYRFATRVFGDFTGVIAVPALLAAILGEYLDTKYNTGPIFLGTLLILAFVGSGTVIFRKVKQYGQEYQKLTNNQNTPFKKD